MHHDREMDRALRAANEVFDHDKNARDRGVVLVVALVVFGAVVAAAGLCLAEEAAEAPRRATVEHAGAVGVWFRADVARQMLADLEELPLVRQRVALLEGRLTVRDDQVERLRHVVELSEEAEQRAVAALDAAESRRSDAERSRDAWWRHPGLWYAVGIVSTAALVALTAYALSSVPDW